MTDADALPIFVYGTLKRGEEREAMWPRAPVDVLPATIRAALYDLGPYPALGEGDDLVAGELWFVSAGDVGETLRVLDAIEGYAQGGDDLYVRRRVDCQNEHGESNTAYTYFFAQKDDLSDDQRVPPDDDGRCRWSAGHD